MIILATRIQKKKWRYLL